MIGLLLWIAGCYAIAAACAFRLLRHRRKDVGKRHYVIVAGNYEDQIEWVIRSLRYQGSLSGTDIGITVLLEPEAADGTAQIVEKLVRTESGVSLIRQLPEADEDAEAGRRRWEEAKAAYAEAWNGPDTVWMELPRSGSVDEARRFGDGSGGGGHGGTGRRASQDAGSVGQAGPSAGRGDDEGRAELTSVTDRLQ
ncbi:hypothetical protein [Cohnella sp. JJ-181]|uniref:hypothetical protein n=1 Tax=Cohnella rhizoplanae TaxID=2974897 RepID=UPI0022FF8B1A|nr:hypothetical protein [Cohnella sp. JJ-181]CAI6084309.1 hypothetical protein COHCIP112018_04295 [Cohnella sp. JJ-181]